jgi:hypothetical protein
VGNGVITPFWYSLWLLGRKPKEIAPLIYEASLRTNWKVREVLAKNAWILKIIPTNVVSVNHIREFFTLWMHDFHLDEPTEDNIVWKHTINGHYSVASAHKAQILGMTFSPWNKWSRRLALCQSSSSSLG